MPPTGGINNRITGSSSHMNRIPEKERRLARFFSAKGITGLGIYCYSEVESTMDTAFALPDSMLSDRTVILAERQSRGRGRFDRTWYDGEGSIALSVILTDFDFRIPYSMVASYAVYSAFIMYTGRVRLKWINDVLWENGKKVSGALTEERTGRTVIGIGVNINTLYFPPEINATSYRLETGEMLDPEDFIGNLLTNLLGLLDDIHSGGIEPVLAKWENASKMKGRNAVVVLDDGTKLGGPVKGLDKKTGALILNVNGRECEVYGGSISFE